MKGIRYDVQTKKLQRIEDEIPLPTPAYEEPIGVDSKELKKLLDYAKSMGWI